MGGHSNTFCPRRAAKDREERQRQHLLSTKGHEGPRRTATATPFVREGPRRTPILVHMGPRKHLFGPLRTPFLIGEGHFLLPFLGRAGSLSMLTGEGTHKGCPYGWITTALTGERAPTRGAPTGGLFARTRGGGHPQGVPLRLDYLRAHGGTGTHKGRPYGWITTAHTGGKGTHKGRPYGWIATAHTGGKGTHKGCPYGWIICAHTGGRAPTRSAPTVGLLVRTRGEGAHKGRPYGWIIGAHTGGGRAQGAPLRLDYLRAHGVPLPDSGSLSGGKWSVEEALRFGLAANLLTWPRAGGGACFWRGRCGGSPPAQGRAEGPTAPMGVAPGGACGAAAASPEPP